MKNNCMSLKRHWFECGFTNVDLQLGMKRVKAVKRAQEHTKCQELQILKEARLKRKYGNKFNVGHGLQEIKQEQDSEFEQRDEEFVIENERTEECQEDCDDFDFSVVKQEPMSESSVDIKTEDNQNGLSWSDSGSLCPREEEDMESSCSKGQVEEDFCSKEHAGQGSFSKNGPCPFTVVRTDGKVMMSEKGIKTEPGDNEYEEAMAPAVNKTSQDLCDEMLCVHFGGPKESRRNLETASTDFECITNSDNSSSVFEPNVNSFKQVDDIWNDRGKVLSVPFVALNPGTPRSDDSNKTTFEVPRENNITLLSDQTSGHVKKSCRNLKLWLKMTKGMTQRDR
ncbi:uncharacterized protein LOC124275306 isoform X2 [Haliotis rubra]|uniref:uncharacterized protein LOC124275306 isoform X2 n=1 Tax=Haliotis rubra TaxID=36100 RepID=UPI001EE56B81|nr:uncharacterized protein LOC124275306 isoform X2 [Haliotis rubra]XP_046566754.1 uncharacterized protein LOC124275306 isoform X2 [Haliotis rubra]